ncbi:MAG: OmpA family protein, partial [Geminicoccaceae bacterium]
LASFSWLAFDRAGREDRPRDFTILFAKGMTMQSDAEEHLRAIQAAMLDNPDYTAVITGHTGTLGNAEVNLDLSEARADAVASALREAGIDPDRMTALGVGAAEPSDRREDEGQISYQKRLSRATVSLRVR